MRLLIAIFFKKDQENNTFPLKTLTTRTFNVLFIINGGFSGDFQPHSF